MKSRFWKIVVILLVVTALTLTAYMHAPLQKPVVLVTFQGFKRAGTNTFAMLCFSNAGGSPAWWAKTSFWEVEAETPTGWKTNQPVHYTTVPVPVRPSSNEVFAVRVPSDAIRWRTTVFYEYYKRRPVRYEFGLWLIMKHPRIYDRLTSLGWDGLWNWLPAPDSFAGESSTPFLTNLPPEQASNTADVAR